VIIADTHVHVYGCHDAEMLFTASARNLAGQIEALGFPNATKVLLLTESRNDHFFEQLKSGVGNRLGEWMVLPAEDSRWVQLRHPVEGALLVFAGRQVVTVERLEILALLCEGIIPDGLGATATIEKIIELGGMPVVSWSPGKWFGARGMLVSQLLQDYTPHQLALGDIPLRPGVWGEPLIMRRARERGFSVLAGSDPLPVAGEECIAGTYGIVAKFDLPINANHVVPELRASLLSQNDRIQIIGSRNNVFQMINRMKKFRSQKTSSTQL
jgi:hypothetical protein